MDGILSFFEKLACLLLTLFVFGVWIGSLVFAAAPTEEDNICAPFFRMADTVGDGTGTKNAIGDLSADDGVPFYLKAASDESLSVARILVLIEDGGPLNADNYGGLAGPLTHGINIYRTDSAGTKIADITDPDTPVVSNMTWSIYSYDVTNINFGSGNDGVTVRWTFAKSGDELTLDAYEAIVIDIDDNLTGLVRHYFQFQGIRC